MNLWIYEFDIVALSTLHLPGFSSAALRGGFGNVLRELTCVTKMNDCVACPVRKECPFTYLFNPYADNDPHFHGGANLPRPFVLGNPSVEQISHGQHARFRVTIVGSAVEYLPYIVLAFRQLGIIGVGKGRGKFRLSAVYSQDLLTGKLPKQVFDHDEDVLYPSRSYEVSLNAVSEHTADTSVHKLKLQLVTPTHLVSQGRRIDEAPSFEQLIRAILRRYSDLSSLYCGNRPQLDYKALLEQAKTVRLERYQLRDFYRRGFSSRRGESTPQEGICGTLVYSGDFRSFLPYLMMGQWIHIGKQATFGMGRYDLQVVA